TSPSFEFVPTSRPSWLVFTRLVGSCEQPVDVETESAHGLRAAFENLGFGEVVQFLENRGVQNLLEPCEGTTGKSSVTNAMIACQSNTDVAVRMGWPVAQQARLRRSRCAEVGPPPRGRRHAVGPDLPAQPWNVQAYEEDQTSRQQWKPGHGDQLAMKSCLLQRGGSGP